MFGTIKKGELEEWNSSSIFWKNIFTHLNLSVCIKREVIMQEKKKKKAALTHVTDMY